MIETFFYPCALAVEMLEAVFGTILYCSTAGDDKLSTEDEGDRHSAIVFISTKLATLTENIITPELEQFILEKCKKVCHVMNTIWSSST